MRIVNANGKKTLVRTVTLTHRRHDRARERVSYLNGCPSDGYDAAARSLEWLSLCNIDIGTSTWLTSHSSTYQRVQTYRFIEKVKTNSEVTVSVGKSRLVPRRTISTNTVLAQGSSLSRKNVLSERPKPICRLWISLE